MEQYLITGAFAVLVAVVEAVAAHERKQVKKNNEETKSRAEVRAEESRLSMAMMNASLELGYATALALEQHKSNGEMHAAKTAAEEAQRAYREFLQRLASQQVSKV